MHRYDRILIDVSNLYYRCFYSGQDIVCVIKGKRFVTGGIRLTLQAIQAIECEYLNERGRLYFLFDNAFSGEEHRKVIDPDYKINRKKRDPQFYRGLDYLRLLLVNYQDGYRVIHKNDYEADDLVDPILKSFNDRGYNVLLVSNDMDWARAVSDNVHWLVKKVAGEYLIYDAKSFQTVYGFYPTRFSVCLYKALVGDTSDNIKAGIAGITKQEAITLVNSAKSLDDMFLFVYELNISTELKDKVIANKGKIRLNYSLIDYKEMSIEACRECTVVSKFNGQRLGKLLEILGFNPAVIDKRLKAPDGVKECELF